MYVAIPFSFYFLSPILFLLTLPPVYSLLATCIKLGQGLHEMELRATVCLSVLFMDVAFTYSC